MVCYLEDCDHETINIIMHFVGIHAYLSLASVSTRWRDAWGQRPRVTSPKWAVQSCSCLNWARECYLDISNKPCLLAAAEGRLNVLEHAVAVGYSREGMPICERAAAGGHLEVVKWCRANGFPWRLSMLRAAEGGHLEVLQWCKASNAPDVGEISRARSCFRGRIGSGRENSTIAVFNAAVRGGELETVRWCFEQGYRWSERTCHLAAMGGHLDLLRWLRDKGCPWSRDTVNDAAYAGDVEMLEWCRANGCPWTGSIIPAAARGGHLETVKWCVANDPQGGIRDITCCGAAQSGHLEVVKWLRAMGCPWGNGLIFKVARDGHFEVLKWCITNGCPWDKVASGMIWSKFNGTVEMMMWATANGCPWMTDPSAVNRLCWHAAQAGNLDLLKWCATNHTIERSDGLSRVARNGHVHVLEWLRANTGVLDGDIDMNSRLCSDAAQSGSLETVKWCRKNNYPWCQGSCAAAAGSGNLELLQWCRANDCPWDAGIFSVAIQRLDFEMLAWCRDNGAPLAERDRGDWYGHGEMVEFCRKVCPRNPMAQAIGRSSPLA